MGLNFYTLLKLVQGDSDNGLTNSGDFSKAIHPEVF